MRQKTIRTVRHVIWDWNGTMLDDAWLCVELLNGMLTARGLSLITAEEYRHHFGFPIRTFYEQLGFDFDTDPFEDVATEFIHGYEERRLEAKLHEGVIETLAMLQQIPCEQSILSAYSQGTLDSIVQHWNLKKYFSHCRGLSDHYAAGKVELGRQLVLDIDYDPDDIVLVGDTTHDAEVADACGIHCLLVEGGHQSRERLESTGVPVYSSLSALVDSFLRTTDSSAC